MTRELTTHADMACTVCGCVCDDLQLQVRDGKIIDVHGACELARPWFDRLQSSRPAVATVEGKPAAATEAVSRSRQILRESHSPLIFGLSRSSTPGQRAAVHLAEQLRANIDTTASVCHGPSIMAIQQVGESTSTLGEIRNRADLVIFWGADPITSHPRHFERYSVDPVGQFLPRGREDRTVVVVDSEQTATSRQADQFLQIHPDRDFEMLCLLRQLIRGQSPARFPDTGVSAGALQKLAEQMTSCTYGVVFFGLGLAQRGLGHVSVSELLRLVAELNESTRFTARRLRIPGDVSGADSVLCWQTGFPFAVNMGRDYPRYNPGEFSANELLGQGETDACVVVGSESVALLSPEALRRLDEIPTIVLDSPHVTPPWQPTVRFTTAVYGIHAAGTVYRMDEVPLPLRCVIDSEYPTDEQVLTDIRRALSCAASESGRC